VPCFTPSEFARLSYYIINALALSVASLAPNITPILKRACAPCCNSYKFTQIRHYSKKPAALDSRFALIFQCLAFTKFDRTAILTISLRPSKKFFLGLRNNQTQGGATMKTMTKSAVIILILISVASTETNVKGYCEKEWPDNFQMQEHCLETQEEARLGVKRILEQLGIYDANLKNLNQEKVATPIGTAILRCFEEWELPEFKIFNWSMVEHCMKQQIESYDRLNR
jgi:hypothetical protein